MATYCLGPMGDASRGRHFPRVLLCERCQEGLGVVDSDVGPEVFAGLAAGRAVVLWPDLADDVRRHEVRCRPEGA